MLTFGPFQLHRDRKLLLENGQVVRLGSRAIDLLVALVERAGEVVGKNELIAYVWPNTFVEENNLRVHIASLRKCLGEGHDGARYIVNVAGRGYCFVAPVSRSVGAAPRVPIEIDSRGNLPVPISRPLGRAESIAALAALVARQRLVTIVGSGGVGKSTVALAVAGSLDAAFAHETYFVDLAAIVNPSMVASAIASAVGVSLPADDATSSLISILRNKRMLLLLDNCEHVIAPIADIAERLLRSTPVIILATSREPLSADGEQIYQLPSLEIPPVAESLSGAEALRYSAVELFVQRAMNSSDTFALTDSNAGDVAAICRLLDGVPLAIEIVAARAALVGISALDMESDDADLLAVSGRRTASWRHRSLRATLDWSYQHLSTIERAVLQRLSVFRSGFTAAAAIAVATPDSAAPAQVLETVMSLAAKSLLVTEVSGTDFTYRLLHVTRVYASSLLAEAGTAREVKRRHAQHWCAYMETAIRDYVSLTRVRWLAMHQSSIDDIRAALDWAFDPGGDEKLGARLTVAAVTFGFQLSLIDEFRMRAQQALAAVRRIADPDPDLEVRLHVALENLNVRTTGQDATILESMERAVALARQSSVPQSTIWPLTTRALVPLDFGDYTHAVEMLDELDGAARKQDDAFAALTADRVGAIVLHWAGSHSRARVLAERVMRHPAAAIPLLYSGVSVDRQVSMRIVLSRILWLEGASDQARDLADEALELAAADQPNAICDALGHAACPIAFWRGDLNAARTYTQALLDCSQRYTLTRWYMAALCFQKVLSMESDETANPIPLPGLQRDLLATITHRWIDSTTLDRARRRLGGWCSPELLRVAGELKLLESGADVIRTAEVNFLQALECAREQRSLAWELRATTSLAKVWMRQDRKPEAQRMLSSVCDRFAEGHETADMLAARALLSGNATPR